MAQPSNNAPYKKEYLPGYTGFVPTKNDRFGMTSGDINKLIVREEGNTNLIRRDLADPYQAKKNRVPAERPNKEIYGNWSKYAGNWISGPTHEIRMQHVPGYTGHVKGMISENLFSKSYARSTATAISKKHPIGPDLDAKARFNCTQRQEFNPKNFRRFVEDKSMRPTKDYNDFSRYLNT